MTKGDKVMIYEDPITEAREEAKVLLLRRVSEEHNGVERWQVMFHDGFTTVRSIKAPA